MSKRNYNNDIYKMYEEEVEKNIKISNEVKRLKLDKFILKNEIRLFNSKMATELENVVKPYKEEINKLHFSLEKAYKEINRLKDELSNKNSDDLKDYEIDKLTSQLSKNSTNSSIPTSKESISQSVKRRTNEYNHRTASTKKSGGQLNHKGTTLTKEQIEEKIKDKKVSVKVIKKYIDGSIYKDEIIKYQVGVKTQVYVEKYIFVPTENSKEKLPKEFYSDVTYKEDIKSLVVLFGNYLSLPYNKIRECLSNLTKNLVNISEGTIDNIYEEFSHKSQGSLKNIENNLLNGKYQHTDETVTKENGKDSYYRGYANIENVLYKYHHQKGDKPIIEDAILTAFLGIIVSDHEIGIFKYGINNQDCIVHFGRYCIEQTQNIITTWQMKMYHLLLKCERNREILTKFGSNCFTEEEIKQIYNDYDTIIYLAREENKYISSKYWKEKANTLLNRCIKYKEQLLYYVHDLTIPSDNNFMERALRMVKSKTKVSGGFRSSKGGERFGNTMSIIKTSKLRNKTPFESIDEIMRGNSLFAY